MENTVDLIIFMGQSNMAGRALPMRHTRSRRRA